MLEATNRSTSSLIAPAQPGVSPSRDYPHLQVGIFASPKWALLASYFKTEDCQLNYQAQLLNRRPVPAERRDANDPKISIFW